MTAVTSAMTPQPIIARRRVPAIVDHTQIAITAGTRMKIEGHRTSVLMSSRRAENARVTNQK